MRLLFLGTSSATPTLERNVSALAVLPDSGDVWIVDCGEGTQHQILRTDLRPARIRRILLTHLHGDHSFGVPGLLASIGIHGREAPLEVIGPRGVQAFVRGTLEATSTGLPYPLTFRELEGTTDLGLIDELEVNAVPIVHRVTCYAYVLRGRAKRGKLDAARAAALGVPFGPLLGELARGRDVRLADGRVVSPRDVLGPTRPGPRVALLGDTSDASAVEPFARGCDVLVHEATYAAALGDKAALWGHSTSVMAGRAAARLSAGLLVLTHFSARYTASDAPATVDDLVREAEAECPGTRVLAARDFMEVEVQPAHAAHRLQESLSMEHEPTRGGAGEPLTAWEHFEHGADIGVRGVGPTPAAAFEQAALALTAVIADPRSVDARVAIELDVEAPDLELLLPAWLNALVYEMATRRVLFSRFEVTISGTALRARAWGDAVDVRRHAPAVEVKGATFTALSVREGDDGTWRAECVLDV